MKKTKIVSVMLILVLVLSMSIAVFADGSGTDINSQGASGANAVETNMSETSESVKSTNTQPQPNEPAPRQPKPQQMEQVTAVRSSQQVMLNGRDVEISAYLINSENYFKLRDIAALMANTNKKFDVKYNPSKSLISITLDKFYEKEDGDLAPLQDGEVKGVRSWQNIEINGKKADIKGYLINNNNYFRLKDLGEALNFEVDYYAHMKKVSIISERIHPKPVPEGEIKMVDVVLPNGEGIMGKRIYPKEIMDEPMRTCYPKAPKGQIVYDILERCYFNDKGEPVRADGEPTDMARREIFARRLGVDPFSFDLRDIHPVDAGGKGGFQGNNGGSGSASWD